MIVSLFKKKEKCIHHWHYIGKKTTYDDHNVTAGNNKLNALFCPKCEEETAVTDERWVQLQAMQKVRESYQKATNTEEIITPTNTVRKGRLSPL